MTLIGNMNMLTKGINTITGAVEKLDSKILSVSSHLTKAMEGAKKVAGTNGGALGLGQGSTGNNMSSSLGSFSAALPMAMAMGGRGGGGGFSSLALASFGGLNPDQRKTMAFGGLIQGVGGIATGAAQMAMAPFSAVMAATMDTAGIVNQAGQFFQLGRSSGLGNRAGIERATFSALQGGITSVGSMGNAAAILGAAGYTAGTTNYLGAMGQIKNAAISTGMTNEAAAAGLANLQSGQTAATMYQYGITTMNPNGTMKSVGDIARQINRTFASGAPMTPEQINMSFQRGNLGPLLQGLGLDANSTQMVKQALIDLSQGKNPDAISQQDLKRSGNDNPFVSQLRMATSQTGLQIKGESKALSGLDAAASTVETFNNTLGGVITSLQYFQSYLDGISGTNAGKGIKTGAKGLLGGAKKILGGALLGFGALTSIEGLGIPLAAAGAGLLASGGGRPGFGASFGGPRGGGNPKKTDNNLVSAPYGATDSSGIWASTGDKHLGTDFNVPVGTRIFATKDGYVSSQTLDKDYGNAVLINHPDGYQTLYAHLSKREVSPGQPVLKGEEIGLSGKSGNTTGPSLHYEVRKGNNNPVDPSQLTDAGSPITSSIGMVGLMGSLGSSQSSDSSSKTSTLTVGAGSKSAAAIDMQKWLTNQGFSENGAFGIVANLLGESGLRPSAVGDGGTSYGIAQWHAGRWDNLNAFAKEAGLDPSTIEAQSQFLIKELSHKSYSDLVATLKDPNVSKFDATKAFLKIFERPANQTDNAVQGRMNRGLSSLGIKGGGNPGYGASLPTTTLTIKNPKKPTSQTTEVPESHGSTQSSIQNIEKSTVQTGDKNVYITVKFDQANEANVIHFANKVQEILDNKNNYNIVGRS